MRMLDTRTDEAIEGLQLYLTTEEAKELRASLERLLGDPEALEHDHLFSSDGGCEMSFSIVTPLKLSGPGYTPAERRLFGVR